MVEIEGISRAHNAANTSDLIILVIDAPYYINWKNEFGEGLKSPFINFLHNYVKILDLNNVMNSCKNLRSILKDDLEVEGEKFADKMCLIVFNKIDLVEKRSHVEEVCNSYGGVVTSISCKDETNFGLMMAAMKSSLETL